MRRRSLLFLAPGQEKTLGLASQPCSTSQAAEGPSTRASK